MEMHPKYLYKYRAISNKENLANDYALDALFHSYAIFSSRRNFNDLFDSKIEFIPPSAQQIKSIRNQASGVIYRQLNQYIKKGKLTLDGQEFFNALHHGFEEILDSYAFFCLSAKNSSNLMWSHYADSHQGFCIEFNYEKIPAEKVTYQKAIPEIKISELLAANHGLIDSEVMANKLWQALRVKLEEWSYEEEYRFQLGKSEIESLIRNGAAFVKVRYERDFVSSIIFGCRMPQKTKEFILKNMPYPVKFKQAVARTSTIEIINYS
jgi:hypothetical protein